MDDDYYDDDVDNFISDTENNFQENDDIDESNINDKLINCIVKMKMYSDNDMFSSRDTFDLVKQFYNKYK